MRSIFLQPWFFIGDNASDQQSMSDMRTAVFKFFQEIGTLKTDTLFSSSVLFGPRKLPALIKGDTGKNFRGKTFFAADLDKAEVKKEFDSFKLANVITKVTALVIGRALVLRFDTEVPETGLRRNIHLGHLEAILLGIKSELAKLGADRIDICMEDPSLVDLDFSKGKVLWSLVPRNFAVA